MSAPVIERQDLFNGVVQRAQRTETLVEAVMFTGLQLVQVHYGEGVVNHTGPGSLPGGLGSANNNGVRRNAGRGGDPRVTEGCPVARRSRRDRPLPRVRMSAPGETERR